MNKALVIGIDDYPQSPLQGCVSDANEMRRLLSTNEDGSPNFDVDLMTSASGSDVSNAGITLAISRFFKSSNPAVTAVLYFAGHGLISPETDAGYLVGRDGRPGAPGLALAELLYLANSAFPLIQSSVIILDCCHAGFLGDVGGGRNDVAGIGKGVTILTSCNANEKAIESGGQGAFTSLLLDAMNGGAADVRGNITPAAVYAHIDQALGAHDQRPLYKANVHRFVRLRQVKPAIPPDVMRRLSHHFQHPDKVYQLDPTYEPDRQHVANAHTLPPVNPEHAAVFKELQMYNRQGLVTPVGCEHMFFAAMESKACKLTALGKHYQRLAAQGK